MQVLKCVFLFLCFRQAGHIELAERLVECQYELTDRLAFYLCGRRPGNMTTIFCISHGLSIAIDSQRRGIVVTFTHLLTRLFSLLFSSQITKMATISFLKWQTGMDHDIICFLFRLHVVKYLYCFQIYTLESSYFLLLSR